MSNRIPFPHILTLPKESNNRRIRFVTDSFSLDTPILYAKDRSQLNEKTGRVEVVYNKFTVDQIKEIRPARWNWSNWLKHPTYYDAIGVYEGQVFESDIKL